MKHQIGNSSVEVISGDICGSKCEVIVSSDDSRLSQGGGVSLSIARAGGDSIADQIKHLIPVELGDVAVTTAGKLPQKYIFHAVTIDLEQHRVIDDELQDFIVRNSVRRCFQIMAMLGLSSIAFPIVGAGVAGIPAERAGRRMAEIFAEELCRTNRGLTVELWILGLPTILADSLFSELATSDGATGGLLSAKYVNAPMCAGSSAVGSAVAGGAAMSCAAIFDPVSPVLSLVEGGVSLARKMFGGKENPASQAKDFSLVDGESRKEVFISYSRCDARSADWVCSILESEGISYWRDVDGTYSGQNFKGVIVRAIRAAHTVFFLSSKNSNASENVVGEIGAALHFKKHVVPIRLDASEYHDDLLLDILNLDNIDIGCLGKEKAAVKIKNIALLNRRRAESVEGAI